MKITKSYDNQLVDNKVLFEGSYEACVAWIRKQPRLRGMWAYDIVGETGHLMSYCL